MAKSGFLAIPPLRGGCQERGVVVRCERLRCTRLQHRTCKTRRGHFASYGLSAHGLSTERARLAGGTSLRSWFQKKCLLPAWILIFFPKKWLLPGRIFIFFKKKWLLPSGILNFFPPFLHHPPSHFSPRSPLSWTLPLHLCSNKETQDIISEQEKLPKLFVLLTIFQDPALFGRSYPYLREDKNQYLWFCWFCRPGSWVHWPLSSNLFRGKCRNLPTSQQIWY